MTLEDLLQHWHDAKGLEIGNRYTFSGPGLLEILEIHDPGIRGEGFVDVLVRDTYTKGERMAAINKLKESPGAPREGEAGC